MKRITLPFILCFLLAFSLSLFAIDQHPIPEPDIIVKGQNSSLALNTINLNSITTSNENGTDFGSVSTSKISQFKIYNNGGGDLILGQPSIQVSGNPDFSISTFPNTSHLFSCTEDSFFIKYTPTSADKDTATITIPNNDSDKSPFKFIVTGSGASYTINPTVWNDVNKNGVIDPKEKGLENVIVNLMDNGVKLAKHITNKEGKCSFNNLGEQSYTIQIDAAALPQDATCSTGGLAKNVNLSADNSWVDVEFGFYGDQVNTEADDPVIPEAYEPELPGNTLVIVPDTGTPTSLVGKCQTSWANLIDQDYDGWDGTVVAAPLADGSNPQVILKFADENIYKFNYIQFQTDNGTDDDNVKNILQTDELKIMVSTTGLQDADFASIGTFNCSYGRKKMQWFRLNDYISAKFIKVIITKPTPTTASKQIVEFAVTTDAKSGAVPATHSDNILVQIPQKAQLLSSYPNPFNPTVSIPFELDQKDHVSLTIYDLQGRIITELVDAELNSGKHQVVWNGMHFPSGVYFVNFRTNQINQSHSIILLK